MSGEFTSDATSPDVWSAPWRLEWDDELRCRFRSAVIHGPRRDQEFVRRSARHLVGAVAHWLKPRSHVWTMADPAGDLAEVLLHAGLRVSVDGSDCLEPLATCGLLDACPGFMGVSERPRKASVDAVFWVDGIVRTSEELVGRRLANAAAALCQDGVLILTAPNNEDLDYGLGLCPACGALFHQWQHVARHTPESIEGLVCEAGFELLALQQLELTESAFRSRPNLFQELATYPRMHLGSGETLVVIARRAKDDALSKSEPLPRRLSASKPPDARPINWTPQSVAHFWDGISSTRLVELGFGRQGGRHLLRLLRPWLQNDQRHLDYGAGTGELAATLLEAGYPTATFEPSFAMRNRQQERLQGLGGFLGVVDRESAAQFDTALLCEVIEHILPEELDQVLSRLNQFLTPNGTVIVTTPNREQLSASTLQCPACETAFHRWQHLRSFDAEALRELLSRFGFSVNVVHEVELTDAAFAANPYADLLFRKAGPIHLGVGSTLVYIGRKIGSPSTRPPMIGRELIAQHPQEESAASPLSQSTARVLERIASAPDVDRACAALLFIEQPSVSVCLEAQREPKIALTLFAPSVPRWVQLECRGGATIDIGKGLVPAGLVLPRDLIVVGLPTAIGRRLSWALMRHGVRRVWFIGNEPKPWAMSTMVGLSALRSGSLIPGHVIPAMIALRRAATRRMATMARAFARSVLPAALHERLGIAIARYRDAKAQRQLQTRVAAATPLHRFRPLLPQSAFRDGPVVLVNNALAWGGVERQVVYVLTGLARVLERPVGLLCLRLHAGDDYRFYFPHLQGKSIEVRDIYDEAWAAGYLESELPATTRAEVETTIAPLPSDVQIEIRRFLAEFLQQRPAVVHAWQDSASISAGYAAVLAGVPRVILSSRNMRPTNFAYHRAYMVEGYRALARVNSLVLVNNSEAGAADYASWLGLPVSRFVIKRNGIDPAVFQSASASEITALRSALQVPRDVPLVGSVFRLYDEKRPMLWIEMAARVARHSSQPHFVIFGTGPRAEAVRERARQLGIDNRLHLPGTTDDPKRAISAIDVFVLTSSFEGTPNVLLEAQLLGVPVVATDAGGTREALEPGTTGWLVTEPTAADLADRVLAVLNDPKWRSQVRTSGPRFVTERFGLERMIRETIALYGLEEEAAAHSDVS